MLSASLRLPLSSLVLDESDDPLWYFLVSILDKACKAILVSDDWIEKKGETVTFVNNKNKPTTVLIGS